MVKILILQFFINVIFKFLVSLNGNYYLQHNGSVNEMTENTIVYFCNYEIWLWTFILLVFWFETKILLLVDLSPSTCI